MDKNVEARQIANKYLETEISNFQIQIQSCKNAAIKDLFDVLNIELNLLGECREDADYSDINRLLDGLLPSDYSLNIKHPMRAVLISELFNVRVKAVQEMIKICEGPYSYEFKGEGIDLATSLTKFFDKPLSTDNWKPGSIEMKNQVLINELGRKIREQRPRTNKTNLSEWISDDIRMKNSDKPLKSETIRKDYLDDF